MVYNNPQPDPDELLDTYRQVKDPLYLKEKGGREHTFRRSLQDLQAFIQPPGELLDVGCYTGAFMEIAAAEGWEVSGVELSSWAAAIAREAEFGSVYEGTLEEIAFPLNSFDVVTLWDVIEHLPQPATMLNEIAAIQPPGGILALSTYLINSLPARILGKHYPFFMDMHLVHFSRDTLEQILREHGYEILSIMPHKRIIRLGYFLDKLDALLPFGHSLFQYLVGQQWISEKFIRIGFSGLANVFARKFNETS